jgi:hypothetical protein
VLTVGAGLTIIALVIMRGHDEPPSLSPAVATPVVPALPPPTTSEEAKPLEAVAPAAASAILPSEAGPAVRTRSAPKQERAAATPSAAPILAAQTPSSSPVGASVATESPAASARPVTPANCTPPYYYDSKMNRVFKKECL